MYLGRGSQQQRPGTAPPLQFARQSKLCFQEADVLLDGEEFMCQRVATEVVLHRVLCSVVVQVLHEDVHRLHRKVVAVL